MVHGAIARCVAVPLLAALAAVRASSHFGSWFGGLAGTANWAAPAVAPFKRPDALGLGATAEEQAQFKTDMALYRQKIRQWKEETPRATQNSAIGATTALLLGLVGSLIGSWMACGERMTFTHYRRRNVVPGKSTVAR
jgi:hypothetical protein